MLSPLKLTTSSYTWGKLRNARETASMLDDLVRAGFRTLALQPVDLLPEEMLGNPGLFKDQAGARGVKIVALGGFTSDLSLDLVRLFDVEVLWAIVGDQSMETWVRESTRLADALRPSGAKLTIHPHLNSPVETESQILEFFARRELRDRKVELCLDPGHLEGAHANIDHLIDAFRARLGLVHVTDYVHPPPGRPVVFEETFVDLGEGIVDYPPILRKLRAVGYDGWYMIEAHYPKNLTPFETVKLNRERFEALISGASFSAL